MGWQGVLEALRATPPGNIWAQAVDGTSRGYDLTQLQAAAGVPYNPNAPDEVEISIYADGNDIYLAFDTSTSRTINDATTNALGATPAFAAASCFTVAKGTIGRFAVKRTQYTALIMKCSGANTATARCYFSSDNNYTVRGY